MIGNRGFPNCCGTGGPLSITWRNGSVCTDSKTLETLWTREKLIGSLFTKDRSVTHPGLVCFKRGTCNAWGLSLIGIPCAVSMIRQPKSLGIYGPSDPIGCGCKTVFRTFAWSPRFFLGGYGFWAFGRSTSHFQLVQVWFHGAKSWVSSGNPPGKGL